MDRVSLYTDRGPMLALHREVYDGDFDAAVRLAIERARELAIPISATHAFGIGRIQSALHAWQRRVGLRPALPAARLVAREREL